MGAAPGANHPAAMASRAGGVGDEERPPHQAARAVRAHHDVAGVEASARGHAAVADGGHALGDVPRPGVDRAPQQPAVELEPRGHHHRPRQRDVDRVALAGLEPAGEDAAARQRVAVGRRRQERERLGRHAAAARLLAGMGGVEEGDRGAVAREVEGQQRAGGPRAHHGDVHAGMAARTSSGETVAVPILPTTTPAA